MTSPLNGLIVNPQNTRKHRLACNFPSSLNFSKDVNKDRGMGGAVDDLPSFDHEFGNAVNAEIIESLQCQLNFLPPLITLKECKDFLFHHRGRRIAICIFTFQSYKFRNFCGGHLG